VLLGVGTLLDVEVVLLELLAPGVVVVG